MGRASGRSSRSKVGKLRKGVPHCTKLPPILQKKKKKKTPFIKKYKTYNTRYSLVVTDPTTNPALTGLSMGERTGSRVFQWVWSYVLIAGWVSV
ncbi:hypothetical protein CTRU02_209193 [Colletotrichum truncatum]|uniref:Uncharacterized protein n=1 Tax=Colletotrichum truncatum TaxID=5467 RepID=A0ACC3YZR9_COLTU